jgi:glycerol-3-phosphate dehydrogenase
MREVYQIPKDIAIHLVSNYGTRALQARLDYYLSVFVCPSASHCPVPQRVRQIAELIQRDPRLGGRVVRKYPFVFAEVVFAMEQEYACTLEDVVARRTRLAFLDASVTEEVLPAVAAIMAPRLG